MGPRGAGMRAGPAGRGAADLVLFARRRPALLAFHICLEPRMAAKLARGRVARRAISASLRLPRATCTAGMRTASMNAMKRRASGSFQLAGFIGGNHESHKPVLAIFDDADMVCRSISSA